MVRISDYELHKTGVVVDITAEPVVRERLLELGLAPGRQIKILHKLPFKGPIVIQAGPLFLALRFEEADQVWLGQ